MKNKREINKKIRTLLLEKTPFFWMLISIFNIHLVFFRMFYQTKSFSVFNFDHALSFADDLPTYTGILGNCLNQRISKDLFFAMNVTFLINIFLSEKLAKASRSVPFEKNIRLIKNQYIGKGTSYIYLNRRVMLSGHWSNHFQYLYRYNFISIR